MSIGIIKKQCPKHGRKLVICTLGGSNVIELEHSHSSNGANITITILEAGPKRANQILNEIFDAQGTQAVQGKATDHGIIVVAVLLKKINRKKGKFGMAASVIANIEVAHFFEDEIGGSRAHDHFREEGGDIDADGHVRNDLFVKLTLDVFDARLTATGKLAKLGLEVDQLALAIIGIHGQGRRGAKRG